MTDAILAGAVLAALAALGIHDARRALVDPRTVLALLGAAAAWRFLGNGGEAGGAWERLAGGVLGAALGVAAVMIPIAVAQALGRRWPLYPGDAMMLGAFGFLLGVSGLAWTMLLGSGFALVHRFWLQRRRGRPFRKGLVPLGPGMCAGAAVVFLCLDCGVALAQDGVREGRDAGPGNPAQIEAFPLAPPFAADDGTRLPATELAPARPGLPADPPPLSIAWHGQLGGLLDRTAALAGYDWTWHGGAVVFHRYWDGAQRGPAAVGGNSATGTVREDESPARWTADPARHGTLRGVLEAWAARAGWTLVWNAGQDYGLGASASFAGSFLEAADLLLSGSATRRTLDARAYRANRHLVVGDAGGAGW